MKILHLVSGLMYGGGQKIALDLVDGLRANGKSETILALLGKNLHPSLPANLSWIRRIEPYDGSYNRLLVLLRAAIQVRRELHSGSYDIVHSHGWDADVIAGLAIKGTCISHVVHQHIYAEWLTSHKIAHRLRRLLTRKAVEGPRTAWIAVSVGVKQSLKPLRWLDQNRIHVVWNGVDSERFNPPKEVRGRSSEIRLGVVARLAPMKGINYLIDAISKLSEDGIDVELWIAGEGPTRGFLEKQSVRLNLGKKVRFLDYMENTEALYQDMDVFVLPSVSTEGLPLSILEAMSSGLPVVSTFLSGIPEAVVDGVTGRLVPPGDSSALARALASLVKDRGLREDMGKAGRTRILQNFTMKLMVDRVNLLYDEIRQKEL